MLWCSRAATAGVAVSANASLHIVPSVQLGISLVGGTLIDAQAYVEGLAAGAGYLDVRPEALDLRGRVEDDVVGERVGGRVGDAGGRGRRRREGWSFDGY